MCGKDFDKFRSAVVRRICLVAIVVLVSGVLVVRLTRTSAVADKTQALRPRAHGV